MTSLALGDDAGGEDAGVASSPDQSLVAVVLQKGDLRTDTNQYSILLWTRSGLLSSAEPQHLLTLSSSSTRPAIRHLRWLDDSRTLLFQGERPGQNQQIYSLNVINKTLLQLTNHPTSVCAFSSTPDGSRFAYTAETAVKPIFDKNTAKRGYTVHPESDSVLTVVSGLRGMGGPAIRAEERVFVGSMQSRGVRAISLPSAPTTKGSSAPSISPDGKKIAIPVVWEDAPINDWRASPRNAYLVRRYLLIDLVSGRKKVLLNSPFDDASEAAWSRDSSSVVLSNMFLPLESRDDEAEKKLKHDTTFAVEVEAQSGTYHPVDKAGNARKLLAWNWQRNALVFSERSSTLDVPDAIYVKEGQLWKRVPAADFTEEGILSIVEEQDMNTPPALFIVGPGENKKRPLLRLNPQFDQMSFSRVEKLVWVTGNGKRLEGGLYYPANYSPGTKYPLVIQTHGFDSKIFQPDGPFSSAFAAQPLAALGIAVFQLNDEFADLVTPEEIRFGSSQFDEVIHHLDADGLVDRAKIGIVGFSRTGFYVKYALTHSKTRFAAAVVEDDWDGSLWQYLTNSTFKGSNLLAEREKGGATPFGHESLTWLKEDPLFRVDHVCTPMRIITHNPISVLAAWGWFSALTLSRKPVEMVSLQFDVHQLKKPRNRYISLQGNVDWLDFWLNGKEHANAVDANEYERWNVMRRMMPCAD